MEVGGAAIAPPAPVAKAISLGDFLGMELPPREYILGPVIPRQGLVMLYAGRGVGKTHVALSIAYAVATGQGLFCWQAPKARRVLYVDGEMPAVIMQERLRAIAAGSGKIEVANEMLKIITPDLLPLDEPRLNLATTEGQRWLEPFLEGVEFLVLDNLATLAPSGDEDKSKDWRPMQEWLLTLRRRGITVMLVHHAGKSGNQRGTSGREDILDTVIALKRPGDYSPEQGARFEVHLEKARGICGDEARPFEATLEIIDGAYLWNSNEIGRNPQLEQIRELRAAGKSIREIAEKVGIPKSTVDRLVKLQ